MTTWEAYEGHDGKLGHVLLLRTGDSPARVLAQFVDEHNDERELIVAAPELLEAAEAMDLWILDNDDPGGEGCPICGVHSDDSDSCPTDMPCSALRRAIALAAPDCVQCGRWRLHVSHLPEHENLLCELGDDHVHHDYVSPALTPAPHRLAKGPTDDTTRTHGGTRGAARRMGSRARPEGHSIAEA